jgi:hypothetical protein
MMELEKTYLSECERGADYGTGLGLAIADNSARSHSRLLQLTDNTAPRVRFTVTLRGVATGRS